MKVQIILIFLFIFSSPTVWSQTSLDGLCQMSKPDGVTRTLNFQKDRYGQFSTQYVDNNLIYTVFFEIQSTQLARVYVVIRDLFGKRDQQLYPLSELDHWLDIKEYYGQDPVNEGLYIFDPTADLIKEIEGEEKKLGAFVPIEKADEKEGAPYALISFLNEKQEFEDVHNKSTDKKFKLPLIEGQILTCFE